MYLILFFAGLLVGGANEVLFMALLQANRLTEKKRCE